MTEEQRLLYPSAANLMDDRYLVICKQAELDFRMIAKQPDANFKDIRSLLIGAMHKGRIIQEYNCRTGRVNVVLVHLYNIDVWVEITIIHGWGIDGSPIRAATGKKTVSFLRAIRPANLDA